MVLPNTVLIPPVPSTALLLCTMLSIVRVVVTYIGPLLKAPKQGTEFVNGLSILRWVVTTDAGRLPVTGPLDAIRLGITFRCLNF